MNSYKNYKTVYGGVFFAAFNSDCKNSIVVSNFWKQTK